MREILGICCNSVGVSWCGSQRAPPATPEMLLVSAAPSTLKTKETGCAERPERRRRPRLRLQLLVHLHPGKDQTRIDSITSDISTDGFLCRTPRPFEKGRFVVCMIVWPSHGRGVLDTPLILRCNARVVRCEHDPDTGLYRTAFRIQDYECSVCATWPNAQALVGAI